MSDDVPFAVRRGELLDRAVAIFSADARFPAGWLEGSLADGSADSYSDIDLHLAVVESAWDEVWNGRLREIERVAPILASLDIMGVFGVGCLMAGPVKLDVFFEREGGLSSRPRVAVKRLWGAPEIYERFKIGDDLGDAAIKYALQLNVLGFLQGATWPVRILARGQINTFLYLRNSAGRDGDHSADAAGDRSPRAASQHVHTREADRARAARGMRPAGRANRNFGAQKRSHRDARYAYRNSPKDLRAREDSIRTLRS